MFFFLLLFTFISLSNDNGRSSTGHVHVCCWNINKNNKFWDLCNTCSQAISRCCSIFNVEISYSEKEPYIVQPMWQGTLSFLCNLTKYVWAFFRLVNCHRNTLTMIQKLILSSCDRSLMTFSCLKTEQFVCSSISILLVFSQVEGKMYYAWC